MKRFTLSFLLTAFALVSAAEPVSRQAALYTARSFMLAKGKTAATLSKSRLSPTSGSRKKASGETREAYYIFNVAGDGGYVIVSGDDRTEPVLGYVEQGSFDPDSIPENMRSWMQLYADEINYIIDNDIQPGSPHLKKRNKVRGTKHSIPELLTSRWNQGHPYNLTCPKYYKEDGTQAYPASGCVATAMAQVMYFYRFPEKTKAVIPSHSNTYKLKNGTEKKVTLPAIPKNTVLDWEFMRDAYNCNDEHVHDRADTAVANLVLYCGQSVKMGYGASSGASTSRARDVYVNYFGYDESAYWGSRGNYGIDEWFDMLYKDISEGYPVLFAGHSSGGGHAFVLDGFDGDNLFHVNWGWGGGSNGWFLVGILNPGDTSGIGASSSSDGYSMSQGAVFNLRLPDNIKSETWLNIKDIAVVSTSVRATFENKTGSTGSFNTGIVKLEDDGSYSLVGLAQNISSMANNDSQTKTFSLLKKLPEGTYRLSPASKTTKSNVWHPQYNMRDQYIEAEVNASGKPTMRIVNPVYDISIDTIVFPGTRIQKQEQEVKVTLRNNADEYIKVVYLLAGLNEEKVYTESKSMVAVRKGETVEVSYFFTPDTTGTYNLWFCTDDKGNNVIAQGTMEVITEAEAVKANLSVSSISISNAASNIAYGKRLIGKVVVRNNGRQDFNGNIRIQLWRQKVGDNTAYSSSSRTFSVEIARNKTASMEFEFENLSEGYYYRLPVYYVNQSGTLTNGGLWDHKWEMRAGVLTWKSDATITGIAYNATLTTLATGCGFFADCNTILSIKPNWNPNTIYAFAAGMGAPAGLEESNTVFGGHASRIRLVDGMPYYIPVGFEADSASFTYTFPETEDGTGWHAFTMPFKVDSIFIDDQSVSLGDTLNHFWIYEYAAQGDEGEIIFAPATEHRGGTPYIIAGDASMAGRSVQFRSLNVPFYKTGSDKMMVTTPQYKFHGNTLSLKLKGCYMLNAEGTAFEYTTTTKILNAFMPYFITTLPNEQRLTSIVLPDVPLSTSPDGINGIPTFAKGNDAAYNLAGQRINGILPRGISIVNGKKIYKR